MRMDDRQRRAMFSRLNSRGNFSERSSDRFVNINRRDKGLSLSSYVPDVSNISGVQDYISHENVPAWVVAPKPQIIKEESVVSPDLDALAEYGKTVKPVDIVQSYDKSDVLKEADDFLARYGRNVPEKKSVVGALNVDDEYALDGPVKLLIRNKVNKNLDELLNV